MSKRATLQGALTMCGTDVSPTSVRLWICRFVINEFDLALWLALALPFMATGKKDGDREAELETAIEQIRH